MTDELFADLEADLKVYEAETARAEALKLREENDKVERRLNRQKNLRDIPSNVWRWLRYNFADLVIGIVIVGVILGFITFVGFCIHWDGQDALEKWHNQVNACTDVGGKVVGDGKVCYFPAQDKTIDLQ